MNRILIVIGVVVITASAGCTRINGMMGTQSASTAGNSEPAQQTATTEATDTESQAASGIYGDIPAGSPFSRLTIGMASAHVIDLIGRPTSQKVYRTGKAWIPFYFGSDVARMEYRYKGQGVITLTGARYDGVFTIYRIIYNPEEDGYMD